MKTFNLSPSSLSLFKECPRCFWLTLHNIWQRPPSPFPSLPSGMDRILKTHFNRFRDKNQLPPELCENSDCKNLNLFKDKELLERWQDNRKGISFKDVHGNRLRGAVDNILQNKLNNRLIVLDYKTRGYPLKEDTHKHYQLQLDCYNYLLRKNKYQTEDFSFLLFYIPNKVTETGEVIFDTTLKKVQTNSENAEKVWRDALKLLYGECPVTCCSWCRAI